MLPHFDLLISRLPDILQKSFCTPDRAMDLTVQMNYVTAFWHVCSQKNYAKTVVHFCLVFLGHPLDYIHIIMCYISYREHYLLHIIYTTLCVTYSHKQHYVRCIFVRFFGATLYHAYIYV